MRAFVGVAACVACCGCGRVAEITIHRGGLDYQDHVEIVAGDRDAVFVRREESGEIVPIHRNELVDVVHPGERATVVGVVFSIVGALALAPGIAMVTCGAGGGCGLGFGERPVYFGGGLALTVVGGGLLFTGIPLAVSGHLRAADSEARMNTGPRGGAPP